MQRLFHIIVLFATLLLCCLGHAPTTIGRVAATHHAQGEVRNAHLWEREQAEAEFTGNGSATGMVINHSMRTSGSHNSHSTRTGGHSNCSAVKSPLHLHRPMRVWSTWTGHILPHLSCDYFIVLRHIIR